jgi:hypothetical protein
MSTTTNDHVDPETAPSARVVRYDDAHTLARFLRTRLKDQLDAMFPAARAPPVPTFTGRVNQPTLSVTAKYVCFGVVFLFCLFLFFLVCLSWYAW